MTYAAVSLYQILSVESLRSASRAAGSREVLASVRYGSGSMRVEELNRKRFQESALRYFLTYGRI